MSDVRRVSHTWTGKPTLEGAGVRLRRVFGYAEAETMDPFLLLDHFGSDHPDDYLAGFPWHPHRGIETVTYMIAGTVEHGDSLGNSGTIGSGDVQWMTAGSGIIHQEMPRRYEGAMRGFQLWVNLPARDKMMRPRYRDVPAHAIPETALGEARAKVIAGELAGVRGPVKGLVVDTFYYDISLPPYCSQELEIPAGYRVFAYVFEGEGHFDDAMAAPVAAGSIASYGAGSGIAFSTRESRVRFILAGGKPLGEPIAWRGPIVMNTQEELESAFREYRDGTFIKSDAG